MMITQAACPVKLFVKTSTNVIIFVQLYMDYVSLFCEKQCLKDKEFQILLDAMKHIIHQELEKYPLKTDGRSSKNEWEFHQSNQLKIGFKFRKNHAKDFVMLGDNLEGTGLEENSGFRFCTYPVFHERLIITVSKHDDMINTKQNGTADVSKYFVNPNTEITMSAERKKSSLSKIRMKMSLKGVDESCTANIEPKQESSSLSSICKKYAYERASAKERTATKSNMEEGMSRDVEGKQNGVFTGDTNKNIGHHGECSDAEENKDSVCNLFAINCTTHINIEQRLDMDHEHDTLLVEDEVASKCKLAHEESEKAEADKLANELDLSLDDFKSDCSKQSVISNSVANKQNNLSNKSSSTRTNDKRKSMEDGPARSLRLSKRRKRTAGIVAEETKRKNNAEYGTEKLKTSANLAPSKNSICIDNYDEVCLDGISSVKDINATQIRSMVRNIERDIRDIFEGKVLSTKHQEYKKGGQSRAQLAYNIHYGEFSEEQQEAITDTLRQLFCYKHSRYFDYILKVLVPETMMMILMIVKRHNDNKTSK